MHALNGNSSKRKASSAKESAPKKKKLNPTPQACSIKETLEKYSDEEIFKVWKNLEEKKQSPHDTTGAVKWDDLHETTDANRKTRYCWSVSKVAYGYGFKDKDRVRVTDLAIMSKLHTTEDDEEREALRESLMKIGKGKDKADDLVVAHLCGRGRRKGSDTAGEYCVNPDHLVPRTYGENDDQVHCHYFLHKGDAERQRFYDSNLCDHDPPCF